MDKSVFVCEGLVTSTLAHVKPLTIDTDDCAAIDNCLTNWVMTCPACRVAEVM